MPSASSAAPLKTAKEEDARWLSPIVLQIAQEAQLSQEELDSIPGTGYSGRLSKKDIKDYVDQKRKGRSNRLFVLQSQRLLLR